jgi:hypothetical protein
MYRIIGADGKEYGPITADQLRQWMAEGRANAQTQVRVEGTTEWKPLVDFPEFVAPIPAEPGAPGAAPPMPIAADTSAALLEVSGPATGLIILAILHIFWVIITFVFRLVGASMFQSSEFASNPAFANMFNSRLGFLTGLLGILIAILILMGGIKMKKLESYGLAMTAGIVALLPCSVCCIIGLPIGIWSLVVLSKPEVKNAFH